MKEKLAKSKFFTKATQLLSCGATNDVIQELSHTYDITTEEIDAYLMRKTKSKAISGAVMASREEKEMIFQSIDQKFLEAYPHIVIFYRGENIIFYEYHDGVYHELLEHDIYNYVDALFVQYSLYNYRTSQRTIKDTIRRIASLFSRTQGRVFTEREYTKKWYLNLKNGLLDMDTFILSPHTPEYFSTVQVPYEYKPEAECPLFRDFITTISSEDNSTAQMIQEMFGYCIGEGNPNHKVFYLYGETARNGKSTTAKIICGLIGWGNVSTLSLAQLAGENSSILSSLVSKQINFSDEISSKYIESSRLTAMSAEGFVEINPKYKHSYLHQIKSKFIITCNDLPQFQDAQGMKYRMISIPFNRHLKEEERILRYDEILLEKEGSGILNWAIEGAKRLKENKVFLLNAESLDDMEKNMLQNNSVYAYLYDVYDFGEYGEEFTMKQLYGDTETKSRTASGYCAFCIDTGIRQKSYPVFCRELKRFSRETEKMTQKIPPRGESGRYYVGLKKKVETEEERVLKDFNDFK